jgi:hypothetical protein
MTSSSSLNECANSVLIKSLFRPAHRADRQIAERRESPVCEAGALRESSAIRTIARFIRLCGRNSAAITMMFRLLDQHGRLAYRAGYLFTR